MTLIELLDYYDDWNSIIKINNHNLEKSTEMKVSSLVEKGRYLNREVMSFGFYDGQLCVRLDVIDL